jgi:hypothetical protein
MKELAERAGAQRHGANVVLGGKKSNWSSGSRKIGVHVIEDRQSHQGERFDRGNDIEEPDGKQVRCSK